MVHHSQIEIERKYDVDDATEPPRLVGAGAVATETEPDTVELVAVYHDTEELTLARHRVAVRIRRGGADEGWHVKLPGEEGRTELHWSLEEGDRPPAELLDLLREQIGDAPLRPIARVTNRRTTVVLQDAAGFALAELCDDHVESENLVAGGVRAWREWEVELLEGAPDTRSGRTALLDEIERRLLAAGAVVSASSSKLARALGL
ncbi:CYTH domain-containing protein [Leifsonia poae]|uniref:CYTH domain-containing protein n=1 Tax=Leifsonia poae TaxID=110933 RepID=UPI001CBE576B|nr:CYTH domain-containing protein [Leifsonia poae]